MSCRVLIRVGSAYKSGCIPLPIFSLDFFRSQCGTSPFVFKFGVLIHLVFARLVRGDYHWPSPLIDQLEGLLYEGKQEGLPDRAVDFVAQLNGCTPRDNNESIAAEWIRFAYHDMATHNVDDELEHAFSTVLAKLLIAPQNVGGGMQRARFDFIDFPNKYVSYSDVIAMGVVLATVECGGPIIAYRGGRIDAMFAGPPGVPTPEQPVEDFIETFRKQGFTQEEMISGVHNPDFETLVPPGDIPFEDNIELFDGTPQFDNAMCVRLAWSTLPSAAHLRVKRNPVSRRVNKQSSCCWPKR
ncbi:heme peroxidase [Mycena olivaceomarginata]|nr:heme peroxidase [Mycena olivaceomarginata]